MDAFLQLFRVFVFFWRKQTGNDALTCWSLPAGSDRLITLRQKPRRFSQVWDGARSDGTDFEECSAEPAHQGECNFFEQAISMKAAAMRMKRVWLSLVCAAMAFGMAGQVQAVILDFDEVPGGSRQNRYASMPTYEGFSFSSRLIWIDVVGSNYDHGAHSDDFALHHNATGAGTITAGGADFTFDGLWAKKWGTAPDSGGDVRLHGTLKGFNNGNEVWSVDTGLNGSYEYYGAQAGAIDELKLGFGNFFLVDDLALNEPTNTVPEPGTMAIWGLLISLGTFVGYRRKRSA